MKRVKKLVTVYINIPLIKIVVKQTQSYKKLNNVTRYSSNYI
jgi:hypothetical protein